MASYLWARTTIVSDDDAYGRMVESARDLYGLLIARGLQSPPGLLRAEYFARAETIIGAANHIHDQDARAVAVASSSFLRQIRMLT